MAEFYTSRLIDDKERRAEKKRIDAFMKRWHEEKRARTVALMQMREERNKPLILAQR